MDELFDKDVISVIHRYIEQCEFCKMYEDIYETCLSTMFKTVCIECALYELRRIPIPNIYRPAPLRKRLKYTN